MSRAKLFDHQKDESGTHAKRDSNPIFWEQGAGKGRGTVESYGDDLIMCIDDQTEEDYIVRATLPDGNFVKILIPKDLKGRGSNHTRPYGLNMVLPGHLLSGRTIVSVALLMPLFILWLSGRLLG